MRPRRATTVPETSSSGRKQRSSSSCRPAAREPAARNRVTRASGTTRRSSSLRRRERGRQGSVCAPGTGSAGGSTPPVTRALRATSLSSAGHLVETPERRETPPRRRRRVTRRRRAEEQIPSPPGRDDPRPGEGGRDASSRVNTVSVIKTRRERSWPRRRDGTHAERYRRRQNLAYSAFFALPES